MHKRLMAKIGLTLVVVAYSLTTTSLFSLIAKDASALDKNVLRRSIQSSPDTLDPHGALGIHPLSILRDLFEGLTSASPDNKAIPAAATEWTISEDHKEYTFKLRKEAKWSDGTPVTADHFVYAWRRCINPQTIAPKASLLYVIENAEEISKGKKKPEELGVEAIDPYTLKVKLKYPYPYFLNLLTHNVFFPIQPEMVEKHGSHFAKPQKLVSNGAFYLEDWHPQGKIILKKNTHYWDKEAVKLNGVIYVPIEDQNALLKMYRVNDIDFTYIIPDSQYDFIRNNFPNEFKGGPYLSTAGLGFNLTRPPFKDNPKLRQALSMAINREFICQRITKTGETPAYSWVDPSLKDVKAPIYNYKDMPHEERLALAKKLYHEAGYSEQNPLEVELRYDINDNHKKLILAVASMWKELGVKTNIINEELKVFLLNRQQKQVTQAFRNYWQLDYYDPFSFTQLFLSNSGMNTTGYCCDDYDQLYKKTMETSDPEDRQKLFYELVAKAQDTHALIPIFHSVIKRLVKPWVKGYEHNPLDIVYSKNLWIQR